jgi:hypothetical protein
MAADIYLYRTGQQHGPYELGAVKDFVQKGQVSITTMSRWGESGNWAPLYCIEEIREDPAFSANLRAASSGNAEIEMAIVEATAKEIGQLIDRLSQAGGTENKELQKVIQRRTQILWRQVYTYRGQFPDAIEAKALEAWYYRLQAMTRFNAAGFLRRQSQEATSAVWGMVTGLLAGGQEKVNAKEALALLDQGIAFYDNAADRLKKAIIYHLLGQREDSLRELRHLMVTWPPEEIVEEYIEARQLRDEIEAG